MRRWRKTIVCPKCQSKNVLKARELANGNIRITVDIDKIRCWNCGNDLRDIPLPYPFHLMNDMQTQRHANASIK